VRRNPERAAWRHGVIICGVLVCLAPVGPVTLARVRLTVFWERMRAQFGEAYADSVAKDYVLAGLGSRTVNQALADGEDVKVVWRAVCDAFRVPDRLR
jgi:Protein of unknown function (DUF3046)